MNLKNFFQSSYFSNTILFAVAIVIGPMAFGEKKLDPPIGVMKYHFQPVDFSIDTSGIYEDGRIIECSGSSLQTFFREKVSFVTAPEEEVYHYLVPSYNPLDGRASWWMATDPEVTGTCSSMSPYFNGLGFASFDIDTGRANIYLTAFSSPPENKDQWQGASTLGRWDLLFNSEPITKNLLLFPAQCDLYEPSGSSSWVEAHVPRGIREWVETKVPFRITKWIESSHLRCVLDGNRGTVNLKAISSPTNLIPRPVLNELLNDHSLLQGRLLAPSQ
jgi:hypothetical protein